MCIRDRGILDNLSAWGSQYIQKRLEMLSIINQKKEFKKQTRIELKSMYNNIANTTEAYDIGQIKQNLIKERLDLSKLKLKLGEMKRLDFVEVELELLKTKLEVVNTSMNYLLTVMNLEVKIGVPLGHLDLFKLNLDY